MPSASWDADVSRKASLWCAADWVATVAVCVAVCMGAMRRGECGCHAGGRVVTTRGRV